MPHLNQALNFTLHHPGIKSCSSNLAELGLNLHLLDLNLGIVLHSFFMEFSLDFILMLLQGTNTYVTSFLEEAFSSCSLRTSALLQTNSYVNALRKSFSNHLQRQPMLES